MSERHSVDQASDSALTEQDRVDVLLDGLENVFRSRLVVYFVITEVILVLAGFALDYSSGSYTDATDASHVMAGIFGVMAIFVAALFALIILIGVFFVMVRTWRTDV